MIRPGGILFDIDGVFFQGHSLIPGAKRVLSKINKTGIPFRFITNTTRMTKNSLVQMMREMGLIINSDLVFAAPQAASEYCRLIGHKRVWLVVAEKEIKSYFSAFQLVNKAPDVVVVGDMGRLFSFELLNNIFRCVLNGADLVAMHKNRFWVDSAGPCLDIGAFIAALEFASNKKFKSTGKPSPDFFKLAVHGWEIPLNTIYVVGDDIEGDIGGAKVSGMRSILVKTGKFRENVLENSIAIPDFIINSIADLPNLLNSF